MNNLKVSKIVSALLLVAFALSAFAVPAAQAQDDNTIIDVAIGANAETGEFSILIAALQAANPNIIEMLSSEGPFTVFAPTDAAFGALLNELGLTAEELLSKPALVSRVLRYHVIRGELDSASVLASERFRTFQGGLLFQNGGVLTDTMGRTANIIATDIQASNGVIHVIDRVVLPMLPMPMPEDKNIVDVVLAANAETGEFSILIAALQAANPSVIGALSSESEFTVFAPTDAAFGALLNELGLTAEQLLAQPALVSKVLRYHLVRGELDSATVLASERFRTFQGGLLYQDGGVLTDANGRTATIIATDIEASNGVIHVIDRVVLPNLNPDSD
jgi:transforming growth factor-beta-induced protein